MLLECGVSLWSAWTAHSAVLLAFGSDSTVELLSAAVVLLQYTPRFHIEERVAGRIAGLLLFVLAGVVVGVALLALVLRTMTQPSASGMFIAAAALVVMPVLATLKRRQARRHSNAALAADAVQSATCAYLALITLAGLAAAAWLHRGWLDAIAALAIVPFLVKEGREAWRGRMCTCC